MSTDELTPSTRTRRQEVGAIVFVVIALVLAAMTTYVLFVPVDANDFETTTGLPWAEFSASNPAAADYLMREARLLAIGFLGLSLMAAAVAWGPLRRDEAWARRASWLFPLALFAASLVFFTGDGAALGAVYLATGALASLGLVATGAGKGGG